MSNQPVPTSSLSSQVPLPILNPDALSREGSLPPPPGVTTEAPPTISISTANDQPFSDLIIPAAVSADVASLSNVTSSAQHQATLTPEAPSTSQQASNPSASAAKVSPIVPERRKFRITALTVVQFALGLRQKSDYAAPKQLDMLKLMALSAGDVAFHLTHPVLMARRFRDLFLNLPQGRKLARLVEKEGQLNNTTSFLMNTMAKAYFTGLMVATTSAGLLGHLVQHAVGSESLGILTVLGIDYVVQVATFSGMFLARHRNYYFDKDSPQEAHKRRSQFSKLLRSDFLVSASIYGATCLLAHAALALVPGIEPIAAPVAAVCNFLLFSTVALGNVMVGAKFMTKAYNKYQANRQKIEAPHEPVRTTRRRHVEDDH